MEEGKNTSGKRAVGTGKRTSYEVVGEREADKRVNNKKKKLIDKKHIKGMRQSGKSAETTEGTRLLASLGNRVLGLFNKLNDQEAVDRASVQSRCKELPADAQKEKAHKLAKNRDMFNEKYEILNSIGKGTYGFVKLAQRRSDFEQVIVKFIKKSKMVSWADSKHGRVPMEVGILSRLQHPNIVEIIDVFESAEFVRMVMKKHVNGIVTDLSKFINRKTCFDEALCSFIFRQVVEAVSYLHSVHVVHRDIKDKNIIIDEHFDVKLIDFGAAAYFGNGRKFTTKCGTLVFSSPEVLLGNTYEGPEQDMWAMGVTLHRLVFRKFPFLTGDDIKDCKWKQPFAVTRSLSYLLKSLLTPDPRSRANISDLQHNSWVKQYVNINKYCWCDVVRQ